MAVRIEIREHGFNRELANCRPPAGARCAARRSLRRDGELHRHDAR